MRLRQRDLQTVFIRPATLSQDDEGNDIIEWGKAEEIQANVQSASGTLNATIYGSKLASMKSIKYQGERLKEGKDEGTGVCLYVPKSDIPDYKIVSIQPFSTHVNIMLERNDDIGR